MQAEKIELTLNTKRLIYSDEGLSDYYVSSLKAVRQRYILFVFMVSSVFFFFVFFFFFAPAVQA